MKHSIREGKSAAKVLQAQIDRAVALADREIGIDKSPTADGQLSVAEPLFDRQSKIDNRQFSGQSTLGNWQSAIPAAPTFAVPPTPAPDPISTAEYTERIRAGWVPVMGLPGTPITSGFVRDLGEYNPKLEGINGIWTYQEMRRGDGQVAGTLRACKMPILSAKWEIVPGDGQHWRGRADG
jgi:hypothetical protein